MTECSVVNLLEPIHRSVGVCGRLKIGDVPITVFIAPSQPQNTFVNLLPDTQSQPLKIAETSAGTETLVVAENAARSDWLAFPVRAVWTGEKCIYADPLDTTPELGVQEVLVGEIPQASRSPLERSFPAFGGRVS
jgi:hypothetical protein